MKKSRNIKKSNNFNLEEWKKEQEKHRRYCEEKRRQDPEWSITDEIDMYFPEDYFD